MNFINLAKPKRYENKKYLAYVRTLPCTICLRDDTEAHHLLTRGAGGSDLTAIALCREHHVEIHKIGVSTMETKYATDWDRVRLGLLERFIAGSD